MTSFCRETVARCSAGFPACGFAGLLSPARILQTPHQTVYSRFLKTVEGGWKPCATFRDRNYRNCLAELGYVIPVKERHRRMVRRGGNGMTEAHVRSEARECFNATGVAYYQRVAANVSGSKA